MQPSINRLFVLTSCFLFALLAGCLESKHPLSDPNNDEIDQSLIGVWVSPTETADDGVSCTTTEIISREAGLPKGVLKAVRKYRLNDRGKVDEASDPTPYFIVPTVVGDYHYLSCASFDEKWKPEMGWRPERIVSYEISKYKIKAGKLTEYEPGEDANKRLEQAVVKGDIRGTTYEEGAEKKRRLSLLIMEPTEGLRKYIEENDSWIFTEKKKEAAKQ